MRPEKTLLKKAIQKQLSCCDSFVLMRYTALSANKANQFRRQVGQLGGDFEVIRKRVLLKAACDADIAIDRSLLDGHVGIVFPTKDPIEMTKMIFKFKKDHDNVIHVIGGRFEGTIYSGVDVERLSNLPGKDEMRAQLLSMFEAPLAQTLAVIEAVLTSVPYCLDNKAKQMDGEA